MNPELLTTEYNAWKHMRQRCLNPKNKDWKYYGGREITICDRWTSYQNFLSDMGRKPSPKLTLERLDNDLGYCPENCAWATSSHQVSNRRRYHKQGDRSTGPIGPYSKTRSRWGLPFTIREMCAIVGIKYTTYKFRVRHGGMTPPQALLTPVRNKQQ